MMISNHLKNTRRHPHSHPCNVSPSPWDSMVACEHPVRYSPSSSSTWHLEDGQKLIVDIYHFFVIMQGRYRRYKTLV